MDKPKKEILNIEPPKKEEEEKITEKTETEKIEEEKKEEQKEIIKQNEEINKEKKKIKKTKKEKRMDKADTDDFLEQMRKREKEKQEIRKIEEEKRRKEKEEQEKKEQEEQERIQKEEELRKEQEEKKRQEEEEKQKQEELRLKAEEEHEWKELLYTLFYEIKSEILGCKIEIEEEEYQENIRLITIPNLVKYIHDSIQILIIKKTEDTKKKQKEEDDKFYMAKYSGKNNKNKIINLPTDQKESYENIIKNLEMRERKLYKTIFQDKLRSDGYGNLLFKGEYLNGERNGKGKEYLHEKNINM